MLVLGILERIHKLNYLASVEASDKIIFPRVKRRLLQLKDESDDTFKIPTLSEMEQTIIIAIVEAINLATECNLRLDRYCDEDLYFPANDRLIQSAVEKDFEIDDSPEQPITEHVISNEDVVTINEDISNINLIKQKSSGISTYIESSSKSSESRNYNNSKGKSCFVRYNGAFIRKTTALYLLQEKKQLSNDRLLRVRAAQPNHLFNNNNENRCQRQEVVQSGDLCVFKQVDNNKVVLGRVIQFSYLEGTKKQREYSSTYVDVTLDSVVSIGVFANWFQPKKILDRVVFFPLDTFTIGYHPMEYYVSTIDESSLQNDEEGSFSINKQTIEKIFPDWENVLCFDFM